MNKPNEHAETFFDSCSELLANGPKNQKIGFKKSLADVYVIESLHASNIQSNN